MGMAHIITRAYQRYGLVLGPKDVSRLKRIIIRRESILRKRQRDGTEMHLAKYEGVVINLVWNPQKEIIVTLLPVEDVNRKQHVEGMKRVIRERRAEAKRRKLVMAGALPEGVPA